MDRPDQILKKIGLLTDKPISPLVNKQIQELLLKDANPVEKSIHLLCSKYRSDMLIYLYEQQKMPKSVSFLKTMLKGIRTNILQYKRQEIVKLYLMILSGIQNDKQQLQIGYLDIIELVLRKPNLQTKQKLLSILCQNLGLFFSLKKKKIVVAIYTNYLQIFNKVVMYVPSFVKMMNIILDIDTKSKLYLNKSHPEKEEKLEEIFSDLTSQELCSIKNQLISMLKKTKDKLNQYSFHRQCMKGLQKIAYILNQYKIKESDIYFVEVDIGQIVRLLEEFVGRKGLNDEAKHAKSEWIKRVGMIQTQKILKAQKIIGFPPQKPEEPMFIEDVISLTNNYRLKYEVEPEKVNKSSIVFEKNFLRKGKGMGGGRTFLLPEKKQKIIDHSPHKLHALVDRCFDQYQKDLEYRSFQQPQIEVPKVEYSKTDQVMEESQISFTSQVQNDEEVEEISNLIDLAYNYKFS